MICLKYVHNLDDEMMAVNPILIQTLNSHCLLVSPGLQKKHVSNCYPQSFCSGTTGGIKRGGNRLTHQ